MYVSIEEAQKHFPSESFQHNTNRLLAACKELLVGDGVAEVGSNDVGFEALGRLVGHLDAVLQHRNGEVLTGIAG